MIRFLHSCTVAGAVALGTLWSTGTDAARTDAVSGLRLVNVVPLEPPRHAVQRQDLDDALRRARLRSVVLQKRRPGDGLTIDGHSVELSWPVRKSVGTDQAAVQAISGFLDQDPAEDSVEDWNCSGAMARTYDGHRGLDIFLAPWSWHQMERDAGIVVAAAPGVILDKVDDQPERSCSIENPAGDANLVVVEHDDGSWGVYAHMRTGSVTAKPVGARVETGEYLGVVGSSGNSTGPHLHLEVGFWEGDSFQVQDPFEGLCNDINASGWWREQREYHQPAVLDLATHSREPEQPSCPGTEIPHFEDQFAAGDPVILTLAARDLHEGVRMDAEIVRPDGSVHQRWYYEENEAISWSHALWTFSLDLPADAMAGEWLFRVNYEGDQQSHAFRVDAPPPARSALPSANNAYNGLWYDPALDGEGYNIVTTAAGTVIYFYGHDRNGRPLWLVSELVTDAFWNGVRHDIAMYQSSGGTHDRPVPANRGLSPWGELQLTFGDCEAGSARLVGEDGDKTSSLVKLAGVPGSRCVDGAAGPDTPYAGLWYDPALDGEGFNLVVTPVGSVLYYYGFDARGNRLWLVTTPFDFDYGSGDEITVDLFKATLGTFDDPVPVSTGSAGRWGKLMLRGGTCDAMEYRLDTREGDKLMDARRLVGVVGLDC